MVRGCVRIDSRLDSKNMLRRSRRRGSRPVACSFWGRKNVFTRPGSKTEVTALKSDFRCYPNNGHRATTAACPFRADFVAKVENRSALKISRKPIFGLLCCCIAFQRGYEGPCSILDETIWSLTPPRGKRISGSENFRSPPKKTFAAISVAKRTFEQGSKTWLSSTGATPGDGRTSSECCKPPVAGVSES